MADARREVHLFYDVPETIGGLYERELTLAGLQPDRDPVEESEADRYSPKVLSDVRKSHE